MKDKPQLLLELIQEFIACSNYVCSQLRIDYNLERSTSLLRARRTNLIPKEGSTSSLKYFSFHGIGCYFELENDVIDVDFGPDDRVDGFDLDRLKLFMQSRLSKYLPLQLDDLDICFNDLIKSNEIYCPEWLPSKHLYYLSKE